MTPAAGPADLAVAIIGIGCRFPGGVSDPASFWRLLEQGGDAVGEIPGDRIDLGHFFSPEPATPGRIMTRWGGFLRNIDTLDAGFFGISPREAERLDPQQRLLLETAWEALEDAGQDLDRLDGRRAGVFVGQWISDFESRLFADPEAVDFQMTTGSGRYAASGRLSFLLGFRGPSLTLDTACSSSLAAVHLAVRSIRSGECAVALAGGINVILQPQISVAYSQSRMMAPDGRCKFGDAGGDGYVRSEGAGLVLLKPLDQALADGDRVYAVIRGSAVNNDGNTSGSLGTPSRAGQEELLRTALADAGLPGGRIGYVEAHGTGTRAGDPVELGALGAVLAEGRPAGERALVGSVKTNLGHTEGAAGVAGLIKAALAVQRGVIPASLHCRTPNPAIPWDALPCAIAREATPWPAGPRLAGVSAFGIAGTNAHVVLEAVAQPMVLPVTGAGPFLLPLSARSDAALRALAGRYAALLDAPDAPALADLCWSAATRRTALERRAAFVAADAAAMAEALRRFAAGEDASAAGVVRPGAARRIAFVAPGQGAQWVGMGRQLLARFPVFRAALEACDRAAARHAGFSILEQLAAEPGTPEYRLDRIAVVQPVLVALALAYAALLRSWGIAPDMVLGHSMGEVAAARIAGVLDLDRAMQIICRRSALMGETSGQGAMALVDLPAATLVQRLAPYADRLSLGASNGPSSSVMSGEPAALDAVMAELERDGVFCRRVKVDVASHSPQMAPAAAALTAELAGMVPSDAAAAIISTALGRPAAGAEFGAEYWGRNLRQPVLFLDAVRHAAEAGATDFVELGPHPILLFAVAQTAPDAATLACGRRDEPEAEAMLGVAARLWAAGHALDWRGVMPEGGRFVGLPLYPWQRERHWVAEAEFRPGGPAARAAAPRLDEEARNWLHALRWQPAPPLPEAAAGAGASWLVATDDREAGAALRDAFAAAGAACEVASLDGIAAGHPALSPAPNNVLVLAGAAADAAFLPVRTLRAVRAAGWTPRLWFATRGGQGVAADQAVSVPQGAAWGAARVVGAEHPELWGGLVDLDPGEAVAAAAPQLVAHLLADDGEDQVAFRGARRALRLVPAALSGAGFAPKRDAAYLVTGGLGALGLTVAHAMAEAGARRLILLGRTPLPPREEWAALPAASPEGRRVAAVRAIESAGAAVHLETLDIADEAAVTGFLAAYAAAGWPPIRGVVHTAGVLREGLAEGMERAAFDAVLAGKLRGAQLLDRLLPELDLFVLFSSMTAFLPQPGTANYAAANAGLDALAQDRRARGLPALSIAWGPWAEGGMLAATGTGLAAAADFARQGFGAFGPQRGAELFLALCGADAATLAVLPADWAAFRAARPGRPMPLLAELAAEALAVPRSELRARLDAAAPAERRALLADLVAEAAARVLKIPPARFERDRALGSMGLNSLMAIELRNALEKALERPISATLAWNHPTVDAIAAFLAGPEPAAPAPQGGSPLAAAPAPGPGGVLGSTPGSAPGSPPGSPPGSIGKGALGDALAEVAEMSDEEAMLALLGQPLGQPAGAGR